LLDFVDEEYMSKQSGAALKVIPESEIKRVKHFKDMFRCGTEKDKADGLPVSGKKYPEVYRNTCRCQCADSPGPYCVPTPGLLDVAHKQPEGEYGAGLAVTRDIMFIDMALRLGKPLAPVYSQ
jgi:hypothetical protein